MERQTMRSWIGLVLLGGSLLVAHPAIAAGMSAKERQAKKACLSGDYVQGVSILAELFIDTGDTTYLYNQGRCYEQNVRYVEAAERFREYLRKAGKLGADDRAEVDKHIADCEAAIAKTRSPEPTPQAMPQSAPPMPTPAPEPAQPLVPRESPSVQATLPAQGHPWQHTAKWVAAGAAVAFLGLGVAEHANYYSKNSDYNNDATCGGAVDTGHCKSLADSADTAQIVAIVGYGAAAVATGLAITFWLTDKPATPAGQSAGLSLTCAPALAGMSCAGRF
jgi:hypothetical protein